MNTDYEGFVIKGDGTYGMRLITTKGSGSIPKALVGTFTTAQFAMKAIDTYLSEQVKLDDQKKKVKIDAKASSTS